MKKKLMMVAVLLGALSLGACVDDNESASVTAVRDAKAAQLNSIAAMNNAEAEAKLIYAQAEAQLKAAEAALQQALADKVAAEAKIKDLEAQMAEDAYDAELAARLAQAEQDRLTAEAAIARINGELQYYQMDLEKRIAVLQVELMQAQMNLQNKQDDIADQEMARLNKLAKNYSTLLYSVTEEKKNLSNLETSKLQLEAELVDLKEVKEETIAQNNAKIEVIDKQIAMFKEYANYTEDVNALQNELDLKVAEVNLANDKKTALRKAYTEAKKALDENKDLLEDKAAIEANELIKMYNNSWEEDYIYTRSHWQDDGQGELVEYIDCQIIFNSFTPIKEFQYTTAKIEREGYNVPCEIDSIGLDIEAKDLRQLEVDIKTELAVRNTKALEDAINNATTGTKVKLDAAKKATEEAKKAWDAAPNDNNKKDAYQTALDEEAIAQSNYDQSVNNLENAETNREKLQTLYALVSSSTADLEKAVKEYNDAVRTAAADMADAFFAWKDGQTAVTDLLAEQAAIEAVLGQQEQQITLYDYIINQIYLSSEEFLTGWANMEKYNWSTGSYDNSYVYLDLWNFVMTTTSVEAGSALNIQSLIEVLETEKENLIAENENYTAITSKEQAIELKQAEIDGKKAVIEALEIEMNQAKTRLDAALAEYDTEEAPAA